MKDSTKNIIVGLSIVATALSTAGAVYSAVENRSIRKMVSGSTERIKNLSTIDIDQKMVDMMVKKAVHDKSAQAVTTAADAIKHDMMADIKNRVKQAVSNQTSSLTEDVAKKFTDEIASISRDDIRSDVVTNVTEKLTEKLSNELDGEIGRVVKVAQGITAALR